MCRRLLLKFFGCFKFSGHGWQKRDFSVKILHFRPFHFWSNQMHGSTIFNFENDWSNCWIFDISYRSWDIHDFSLMLSLALHPLDYLLIMYISVIRQGTLLIIGQVNVKGSCFRGSILWHCLISFTVLEIFLIFTNAIMSITSSWLPLDHVY